MDWSIDVKTSPAPDNRTEKRVRKWAQAGRYEGSARRARNREKGEVILKKKVSETTLKESWRNLTFYNQNISYILCRVVRHCGIRHTFPFYVSKHQECLWRRQSRSGIVNKWGVNHVCCHRIRHTWRVLGWADAPLGCLAGLLPPSARLQRGAKHAAGCRNGARW